MTDSRAGKTNMTFTLDRGVFNMIMINSNEETAKSQHEFLKTVDLCAQLPPEKLDVLSSMVEECTFNVGEYVWSAGETVEALYFLREGEMAVIVRQRVAAFLQLTDGMYVPLDAAGKPAQTTDHAPRPGHLVAAHPGLQPPAGRAHLPDPGVRRRGVDPTRLQRAHVC